MSRGMSMNVSRSMTKKHIQNYTQHSSFNTPNRLQHAISKLTINMASVFIQQEKKKRLNLDVIGQLEDDLETDPLDYHKWTKLINQVIAKDKEEQVRAVYTKYFEIFKFDVSKAESISDIHTFYCLYTNTYSLTSGAIT